MATIGFKDVRIQVCRIYLTYFELMQEYFSIGWHSAIAFLWQSKQILQGCWCIFLGLNTDGTE